jgi:hypothetical protein
VRCTLLMIVGALALTSDLNAQRVTEAFRSEQDTTHDVRSAWRPLRIAKWTSLIASTGAAAYGFSQNRVADREYEQLERDCEAAPFNCTKASESGPYLDAALEQKYQRILDRDENARLALLAGQVGIAASVIMFIIDLPDHENPGRHSLRAKAGARRLKPRRSRSIERAAGALLIGRHRHTPSRSLKRHPLPRGRTSCRAGA